MAAHPPAAGTAPPDPRLTARPAADAGSHHLRIAGVALDLRFSERDLEPMVLPAVGMHRSELVPGEPSVPWLVSDARTGDHAAWDAETLRVDRLPGGGIRSTHPDPPLVEVEHPTTGIELWGSTAGLGSAESRSHPAATALSNLLARDGRQTLHVGAVEIDGNAALIVGPPGAGKSTTALAAAVCGAGFIGDDACALDDLQHWTDGAPTVHALFASAKLWPDSGDELGAAAWTTMGRTSADKPVVSVDGRVRVTNRGRVTALVILRPPGPVVTGPTPIAAAHALRGLIPTVRSNHIDDRELRRWAPLAAEVARRVPAYAIGLGWDLPAVAGAVVDAIEAGARRGPS
ncbi:MAG: hypothetical protein JO291_13455 [Acidimicrobiia bacterium]|nr:hypothetical protein [Acidimicrobiia bacterium]